MLSLSVCMEWQGDNRRDFCPGGRGFSGSRLGGGNRLSGQEREVGDRVKLCTHPWDHRSRPTQSPKQEPNK